MAIAPARRVGAAASPTDSGAAIAQRRLRQQGQEQLESGSVGGGGVELNSFAKQGCLRGPELVEMVDFAGDSWCAGYAKTFSFSSNAACLSLRSKEAKVSG